MTGHWTLDDIRWDKFEADKVDKNLLKIVKAASLVEYNGEKYTAYLCNVFHDDAEFQADARRWGEEEQQHGVALGRWAEMADPGFDFEAAVERFNAGFEGPPLDVDSSVRGSRSGELVARCIVESGTSSYYSALAAATNEPVLKDICRRIAGDEFRHYKLFYDALGRYQKSEGLSRFERLRVALGRVSETEDDELSYAYYAANAEEFREYDRKAASSEYLGRAYNYYQPQHIERAASMILKAVGITPKDWVGRLAGRTAYWFLRMRKLRYGAPAAA